MPLEPPLLFPAVVPGEPIVLSASAFVTFSRCPEQAVGRLRGMYPPESRASFLGGLARRIFARLGLLRGDESYAEAQRLFMDRLPRDPDLYNDYHAQIVRLAKDHCRPRPRGPAGASGCGRSAPGRPSGRSSPCPAGGSRPPGRSGR